MLYRSPLARFLVLGAFCFALNLGILYVMVSLLGAHYLLAMLVSLVVANGIGFLLNRRFTFAGNAHNFWRELRRYFAVNLGAFALNFALMALLVSGLKVPYLWANSLLGVAFASVNFLLHSKWSFARR